MDKRYSESQAPPSRFIQRPFILGILHAATAMALILVACVRYSRNEDALMGSSFIDRVSELVLSLLLGSMAATTALTCFLGIDAARWFSLTISFAWVLYSVVVLCLNIHDLPNDYRWLTGFGVVCGMAGCIIALWPRSGVEENHAAGLTLDVPLAESPLTLMPESAVSHRSIAIVSGIPILLGCMHVTIAMALTVVAIARFIEPLPQDQRGLARLSIILAREGGLTVAICLALLTAATGLLCFLRLPVRWVNLAIALAWIAVCSMLLWFTHFGLPGAYNWIACFGILYGLIVSGIVLMPDARLDFPQDSDAGSE